VLLIVKRVEEILSSVRDGTISVEDGVAALEMLPFEDMGFACLDHHRQIRKKFPEVIYSPGKSCEQLVQIMESLIRQGGPVLATRVSDEQAEVLLAKIKGSEFNSDARAVYWMDGPVRSEGARGDVLVITAGTADIPVAKEACLTLKLMGQSVERIYDVGVAGIHRLFARMESIRKASVIVVAAGMDGALPGIVGGVAQCPVIAVPVSSGYGASFNGVAALLTMLNACSPGVAVVNIDNGFGAGIMAGIINRP
jgi:NCAIR mutase (PurE)-related protein